MLPEVMIVSEVAQLLRVSRHTVYRLAARGELPGRKVGRIWRFQRGALEDYLRGRNDIRSAQMGPRPTVGREDTQGSVEVPREEPITVVEHAAAPRGRPPTTCCAGVSTTSEKGPWSETASATIGA